MVIPRIKRGCCEVSAEREVSLLNRNKERSGAGGKGGFQRGKNQRGGIPLAAIGRKIMPAELVSEKLEKQERKKSEGTANNTASVSKKHSAEGNGKPAAPRQANVQRAQQKEVRAKTPVRIIPLGGLGEIGKNMTVIECANDMFIIDCGLAFPDADMLGVDLVIPDFTYIERNADKLRGIVLTHGHEDHIGGLAYLLKKVNTPDACAGRGEAQGASAQRQGRSQYRRTAENDPHGLHGGRADSCQPLDSGCRRSGNSYTGRRARPYGRLQGRLFAD